MAYILLHPQRSPLILNTTEAFYQHTVPILQRIGHMLKWMAQILYEPWIELFGSLIPLVLVYAILYFWSIVGLMIIDFKYLAKCFVMIMLHGDHLFVNVLRNPSCNPEYEQIDKEHWTKTKRRRNRLLREYRIEQQDRLSFLNATINSRWKTCLKILALQTSYSLTLLWWIYSMTLFSASFLYFLCRLCRYKLGYLHQHPNSNKHPRQGRNCCWYRRKQGRDRKKRFGHSSTVIDLEQQFESSVFTSALNVDEHSS